MVERDDELEHLRRLYPDLSDAELHDAADRLDRYLKLTLQIFGRIQKDPTSRALLDALLDERRKNKNRPET